MNRTEKISVFYGYLALPFMIGTIVISGWSYIWTIYLALNDFGFFGFIISMMTPVLSQLFYAIKIYNESGLESLFVKINIIMIICMVLTAFLANISKKYEDK